MVLDFGKTFEHCCLKHNSVTSVFIISRHSDLMGKNMAMKQARGFETAARVADK